MCIRILARMSNLASTWFDALTNRRSASEGLLFRGGGNECGTAAFIPSPQSQNLNPVPEHSRGEIIQNLILSRAIKRIHIKTNRKIRKNELKLKRGPRNRTLFFICLFLKMLIL